MFKNIFLFNFLKLRHSVQITQKNMEQLHRLLHTVHII